MPDRLDMVYLTTNYDNITDLKLMDNGSFTVALMRNGF